MCGIAGQVRAGRAVRADLVHRMCAAIEHRGPDARGVHIDGRVGLGIQRLRVIDLETGDQPIFNEDRSIVVVLNGEIYNFRELRDRLQRRGHVFTTRSDTEVIVHLYEEEGRECVSSLHGMFAFALWDENRQELLLARDRVGKKPLFYSHLDGDLSFASELPALMQNEEIPRTLDHRALDCYYAYQYVPAPLSVFEAARKLPPASILRLREGRISIERYWRLDYTHKRRVDSMGDLRAEIRSRLETAVRRRLVSDVPLGVFLSGGVDSSAVVAAMARLTTDIKTFSIGFADTAFNELPHARRVAEQFGTDHHEFVVVPSAIEILPQLVRHYGEPFADDSAIPSFYLSRLAREHVTVALNGDGGDESFAGYNRYAANVYAARLDRLPLAVRRLAAASAGRLPSSSRSAGTRDRLKRLALALPLTPPDRYACYMSTFTPEQRARLYSDEYREQIGDSLASEIMRTGWGEPDGKHVLDALLNADVETFLPGDLLVKMDIASMAHGLEARSPFLDHELMEFAASLPAEIKLSGREKKLVLREAVAEWLPQDLLDRPKQGFSVPLARWLREDLREFAHDVLLDPISIDRGYFRRDAVESLLRRHVEGREDCSKRLWTLLFGELWHREFVDLPPAGAVTAAPARARVAGA
ncbi:MAG: asparagine synthase (glutamine-hydrolyzing) [Actinobacteria bacterium]|nr:asparagine synthase (glutamine-hydrolyzing) [Actinomycetota bacterium]